MGMTVDNVSYLTGMRQDARVSIADLSEYTDSESKQMYFQSEITHQEYEDKTGTALD